MSSESPRRRAEPEPSSPRTRRKWVVPTIIGVVLIAVIVAAAVLFLPRATTTPVAANTTQPTTASTPSSTPTPTATPTPTPTPFDKHANSLTNPASKWVIVNKQNPLNPKNYAPPLVPLNLPGRAGEMRPDAAKALQQMFAAYHAQSGAQLSVVSPYRSYPSQISVYNGWVSRLGKAQADRQSARPGFSEHQTGLAVDIDTAVDEGFGKTPAGSWLRKNSWKFGFIVRYPEGQEKVTGYEYEPWHFRFLGVKLATEMHTTKATSLEAFFGYPPAPNY